MKFIVPCTLSILLLSCTLRSLHLQIFPTTYHQPPSSLLSYGSTIYVGLPDHSNMLVNSLSEPHLTQPSLTLIHLHEAELLIQKHYFVVRRI